MTGIFRSRLIIIVAILVALVAGWFMLSGSSSAPTPLLTATPIDGTSSTSGSQNLVSTLLALRAVKLDATVFSDPAFLSMKDFSVQIVLEPAGRPDPFAPLGVTAQASASTTRSAQIFTTQH